MNNQTEAAPQPGQIVSIAGKQIVVSLPDKKGNPSGYTITSPPKKITFTLSEIESLETEADTEAVQAFQDHVENRRARLEGQATASFERYQTGHASAKKKAEQIPFGQPLHLDGNPKRLQRDRNFRDGIDRQYGRAFRDLEESKRLQVQAKVVGGGGISKDDPEAIQKLTAKLGGLQWQHKLMKLSNAIIKKKATSPDEKREQLEALGQPPDKVDLLIAESGYRGYELTSANTKVNATKKRIINLVAIKAKRLATGEPIHTRYDDLGLVVIEDYSISVNRLQVVFDDETESKGNYQLMKDNGFKFSHTNNAYQRGINTGGRWAVDRVIMTLREGITNE